LKSIAAVSRIRLLTWDWVRLDHRYQIESSTNKTDWSVLVDASGEDHRGWEDIELADVAVRYLRFTGLQTTQERDAVSVSELEVYGSRILDLPDPAVSTTNVNVREGGEGRFFVRMDQDPNGNVSVTVSRDSGSTNITILNGATRAFKSSNWDTWQVVTLVAPQDADATGETAVFKVSAPGVPDQFVNVAVLDDEIGVNYALASGGSTIAVAGGSRAAQMIDGVHTVSTNYGFTIWTNTPQGTVTLDLKRAVYVSRIRLLNWDWVYRVHRYQIESSTNGTDWVLMADASAEDRQGWDDWAVADTAARFLRFTGLSNSANQCVVLSELEVYGDLVPLDQAELSPADVSVREAGYGRFFVRLPSAPTGNVVVTISHYSGDASITIASGATRGFKPSNWNVWQAVVLQQAADGNTDGETAVFKVSAPNYADVFLDAAALDDDIGENLALASGGATISGTGASRVEQMIDGIHSSSVNYGFTTWTNVPPGEVILDMHGLMTVTRLRVLNWDWVRRMHRYTIEASTDGVDWDMLADASAIDRQGWDDWAVPSQTIRYLRFTGISNSANSQVVIPELEVYGTRPLGRRALKALLTESELVTVVTSDDVAPDYESGWAAVDGDLATAWTGQKAGGGYILLGFDPALELGTLEVDLAEDSLTDIEYLYSQDGEDWQPLPEDMEKNPVSLNFLWLVFPDDGTDAVPSVLEIQPNP
jgi:hypothetical protein